MQTLTTGHPLKKILLFSAPIFIGFIFQQLYSVVDLLIVGHVLGESALGAVGISGTIISLILSIGIGITGGLTIPLAKYFGAKEDEKVKTSFAIGICITLVTGLILSFGLTLFTPVVMHLLQVPPTFYHNAEIFITINSAGFLITIFFNLFSNAMRAIGNSKTPLYFLIVSNVFNALLAILFVAILHFGIAGSAFATILAQIFACGLCIFYISKYSPQLKINKKHFVFGKQGVKEHLKIGIPMGFQSALVGVGNIVLQIGINHLGNPAVLSYSIINKVELFLLLPLLSISIAMATFNAQNLGARQFTRILIGMKQVFLLSTVWSFVLGTIFLVFYRPLVTIFLPNANQQVFTDTLQYFEVTSGVYFLCGALLILRFGLQGLNKTKVATITGFIELFSKCFAVVVFANHFGFAGIALSNPLSWVLATALLWVSYIKTVKELKEEEPFLTEEYPQKQIYLEN